DPDGGFRWLASLAVQGCRGNDAAVDAAGHLWAGTMPYDETPGGGRLYRVGPGGEVVTVLDGVTVSNGIGWSPDERRMYYVDSPTRRIDMFDYDVATGEARDRRSLVELTDTDGVPDGLCVDAEGCVWVAVHDAGQVRRYTPDGVLDRTIEVPAAQVTACCFGGDDLADLYITTSREGFTERKRVEQPLAGTLFVATGIGSGMPSARFPD
ncbi:MAG TPA: SMP-30/gluconolactonase/LRE family protein, partial [Pseudonocardiaceae bacterium]